jgi:hypothetical protein
MDCVFGDLVARGRILLAAERHKKGEASLGRAAELAGIPLGKMISPHCSLPQCSCPIPINMGA